MELVHIQALLLDCKNEKAKIQDLKFVLVSFLKCCNIIRIFFLNHFYCAGAHLKNENHFVDLGNKQSRRRLNS